MYIIKDKTLLVKQKIKILSKKRYILIQLWYFVEQSQPI